MISEERSRLEAEVVKAAMEWRETADDDYPSYMKLIAAVDALIAFEEKN